MIYVIGGRGFVGSAIVRLLESRNIEHRSIERSNFERMSGSTCDILINANGNSKKYLAAREPLNDFDQSVRSVAVSFESFKFKTYALLSTGDVYPNQSSPAFTEETTEVNSAQRSRYALHKNLAELLVRGVAQNWLIIRMGGFVGPGLKKNAVYDMLKNSPIWLSPSSELQFISTDRAAHIIWSLCMQNVRNEIVNLGAEGVVNLGDLHSELGSTSIFRPDAPTIRYELSLKKLRDLIGEPLPNSREEVLAFVRAVTRGDLEMP